MINTGDSPSTLLKYYTRLPEGVMRRSVESKPVILQERVLSADPAARLKLVSHQPPLAPKALKDAQVNALLRAATRSSSTLASICQLAP